MIELAIVMPLLIFLALVGYDIARALNTYQVALSLSKQIASAAYRECVVNIADFQSSHAALSGKLNDLFSPQECLTVVRASLNPSVVNVSAAATYSISMVTYDAGTGGASLFLPSSGNGAMLVKASDFQSGPGGLLDSSGSLAKLLHDYGILVIAEVHVPYQAFFESVLQALGFSFNDIHAQSIL
ncbi:MAG TPA: hypothetical protein PLP17_09150 [Oligoflexia bacterium]|nr:hypothetical protein [Oligoflexia bacterium]